MLIDSKGKVIKAGQTLLVPLAAVQQPHLSGIEIKVEEVGQTSSLMPGAVPEKFIRGTLELRIPLPINIQQLPGMYVVAEAEEEKKSESSLVTG